LITLGVGLGVGEGVGDGVGVGVGVGVGDCADAEEAMPTARTKAMATSGASRPSPIFLAREQRDRQRMHSIPNRRSASPKNAQNIKSTVTDLPPLRRERQSVGVPGERRMPAIVVRLPQRLPTRTDFVSPTRGLLTREFRVAIRRAIGLWLFDCAFLDLEI
jgi:hypothetical protein